jgi:hypothetical protein
MGDRGSNAAPAELVERVEAEAWAEQQLAAPDAFRVRFGIEVRRPGGGVALIARNADVLGMNRVFALGFTTPLGAELLDRVVCECRDAGVKRLLLHWSPVAAPGEAPSLLHARGFRARTRMAKLCRRADAAASAHAELRVVEIGVERADDYAATMVAGHGEPTDMAPGFRATIGLPRWRHYLATDGDSAVAAAALFVLGDVGWCGCRATLPGDRGRGAHGALLARRVRDACAMGYTSVACETMEETPERSNPSYRNMRRAGFDLVYLRPNYPLARAGTIPAERGATTTARARDGRPPEPGS